MEILIALTCLALGILVGKFFPWKQLKEDLIEEGVQKECHRNAEALCGLYVCIYRHGGGSEGGFMMPWVTLENIRSMISLRDWPSGHLGAIKPGDEVRVVMKNNFDLKAMNLEGYQDLLEARRVAPSNNV